LVFGILIFINVAFFNYPFHFEKSIEAEERIPVLSYLQNHTTSEIFRAANFGETNIDDSMAHYHLHYGLESYIGFDGAMWIAVLIALNHFSSGRLDKWLSLEEELRKGEPQKEESQKAEPPKIEPPLELSKSL
jgi:hypothetical protein